MDDLSTNSYVGEKQELCAATNNISKEEHEMQEIVASQQILQQAQINQSCTETQYHGFQKQMKVQIEGALRQQLNITFSHY